MFLGTESPRPTVAEIRQDFVQEPSFIRPSDLPSTSQAPCWMLGAQPWRLAGNPRGPHGEKAGEALPFRTRLAASLPDSEALIHSNSCCRYFIITPPRSDQGAHRHSLGRL